MPHTSAAVREGASQEVGHKFESPKRVSGTQVLESLPAASQGAHMQEARIGSGARMQVQAC